MKVKEIMTSNELKHCTPETPIREVARTMEVNNCGAIPVTDQSNKVIGMVTDRDICLAVGSGPSTQLEHKVAKDIMSTSVETVLDEDDVTTALRKMRTKRIGRLPVLNREGKLTGILSVHNLMSQPENKLESMMGRLNANEENIIKTIRSLSDRYSDFHNGSHRK